MKKSFISMFFSLFLLVGTVQTSIAVNNVSEIYVDVVIYDDGSAYITQTWRGNFTEGTEGYIPIENLGEMSLTDVLVSDINGSYSFVDKWDVNASFAEKTGRFGLLDTENGYEICWGISEYGDVRYAIEYRIKHLVGAYQDFDGFNFQFINPGMGTLPTDVMVAINMHDGTPLDSNNAGIWAFGFNGQIVFEDGMVRAYTEKPLTSNTDSVIIMLQLNKGVVYPQRIVNDTFAAVKALALKDSDYSLNLSSDSNVAAEELSPMETLLAIVLSLAPLAAIYYFFSRKLRPHKSIRKMVKEAPYYRDVPLAGNIEASFALAKQFKQIDNDGDLIGAAFFKLINSGCLEALNERTVGLLGKVKDNVSLVLIKKPNFSGAATNMLYELLERASNKDQILQESELEKYCTRQNTAMMKIIEAARVEGRSWLNESSCFATSEPGSIATESTETSEIAKVLGLSVHGETMLLNIIGFKKYLLDFSLIGERSIEEAVIWEDYLTFATLLGIADKALEQFKKVYPEITQYRENARNYYLLAHKLTKVSYYNPQATNRMGTGGKSSLGGGGGFSGGGSRGGTR